MENLELKIKELKNVKPDGAWVANTKNQIMNQKEAPGMDLSLPSFTWLPRQVFLVVPVISIIFLLGFHFYTYNIRYPRISSRDLADLEAVSKDLGEIESSLIEAREGLANVDEPGKALKISKGVTSTIKSAEKLIKTTKEIAKESTPSVIDPKAFSAISGVEFAADKIEQATKGLEETYIVRQKEIARQQIGELEERSLNEEQLVSLEEAKDLYDKGEFEQALEKVLEMQNY